MSKIHHQSRKAALAIALASGRTVKEWADENGVPERTAYSWSCSPDVVDRVEDIRRAIVDRAVGQLCEHTSDAIKEIVRLLKDGKSESVRLQAARAVLADLMAVSSYAALNGRMAELERMVREKSQPPTPADPSPAPGLPSSVAGPQSDPSGPPA
jgi:hypothetical protein